MRIQEVSSRQFAAAAIFSLCVSTWFYYKRSLNGAAGFLAPNVWESAETAFFLLGMILAVAMYVSWFREGTFRGLPALLILLFGVSFVMVLKESIETGERGSYFDLVGATLGAAFVTIWLERQAEAKTRKSGPTKFDSPT